MEFALLHYMSVSGLSVAALSRQSGVPRQTIHAALRFPRHTTMLYATVCKLAAALDVEPETLSYLCFPSPVVMTSGIGHAN